MRTLLETFRAVYRGLAAIPVAFLGIGMQRAWTSLTLDTALFPLAGRGAYLVGIALLAAECFVLAALAGRLAPLWRRPGLVAATATAQVLGTGALICAGLFGGGGAGAAAWWAGAATAAGLAVCVGTKGVNMLLWCELFSKMPPTRVALTYSAALVFGALIGYFLTGMSLVRVWPLLLAMPVLNAVWGVESNVRMVGGCDGPDEEEAPSVARTRAEGGSSAVFVSGGGVAPGAAAPTAGGRVGVRDKAHARTPVERVVSFPWQPVVLMAVMSFAGAFMSAGTGYGDPLMLLGTVAVPLLVIAATVVDRPDRDPFGLVYRLAVPVVTLAMLFTLPLGANAGALGACLFRAGDVSLWIVTMVVFSGFSYRYGVEPDRLNGIERGVRHTAYLAGWAVQHLLSTMLDASGYQTACLVLTGIAVLVFSVIFLPNRLPMADWGAVIAVPGASRAGAGGSDAMLVVPSGTRPAGDLGAGDLFAEKGADGVVADAAVASGMAAVVSPAREGFATEKAVGEVPAGEGAASMDASHIYNPVAIALACEAVADRAGLTTREREVLLLMAQKRTPLQIENELVIAQGTLKAHVSHIYAKLGVHNRTELYALLEGGAANAPTGADRP